MKKTRDEHADATSLRKRAESQLAKNRKSQQVRTGERKAHDESQRLIQELQIHQIELELQNEELMETRNEMERERERYADLYDFAPCGYFVLNTEGVIREANLAGARMLEVERSRLVNRRFGLFVSPADDHIFDAFLKKVFEKEDKTNCEVLLRDEGRLQRCLLIEGVAIETVAGKEDLCRVVATDISEGKRAEKALRDSEVLYHSLFEHMLNGFAYCRMLFDKGRPQDFIYLNVNRAFESLTGLKNVNGKKVSEVIPGIRETDPELFEIYGRVALTGNPESFETYVEALKMWFSVSVYSPEKEHFVAIFDVITERKQIEDTKSFLVQCSSVPSGEDFFISLARYLGDTLGMDFVCIDRLLSDNLSAQTVAIYFDGKFEDNISYTLKDTPCGDVVGKTVCCFPEGVRKLFPNDAVLQEMIAESYVGVTLWSSQGQPIGLIAVIGRKPLVNPRLAESILNLVALRAAGELEHRDAEEEIKRHANQLEETNKELESFSYSVSHDLRAPLRAIDGYVRMILKKQGKEFDQDTEEKFNVIRDNTHMMGQLIDDLLAFSRLGRTQLSKVTLDIEGLISEVWEELKAINPDRRLTLKIAGIRPCRGDRALIKQVLVNLLGNAVKFSWGREEALIEAGVCNKDDEIVYYVRDNGAGFDMRYYDKLFGVFQRLHSAEEFEGTGVGLAIVQRIIHRHGGRVWAEGKVNEGAMFYFTLPT